MFICFDEGSSIVHIPIDEISQLPYLDEEKLPHILSMLNTPNNDTEQATFSPSRRTEASKILTSVFSNPYALSKSFLKRMALQLPMEERPDSPSSPADSKHKLLPGIGVDVKSVARVRVRNALYFICMWKSGRFQDKFNVFKHVCRHV